ncbi:30S ribosomal protein S16 [Patescibacteria group bacterium]|nr:30S ribosomal protein S16 [Patescibacteria group bacterium]
MMLTIRLSRTGKKHAPQYRIVLQEKGRDPWSPAIEILGNYNPRKNPSEVKLEAEKIKEWIAKGAQPSNTVHNLLVNEGIIKADKSKAVTITKKRAAKITTKKAEADAAKIEAAEKAKEAEEAKKAEAEAKKVEEEALKAAAKEEKAQEAEAKEEQAVVEEPKIQEKTEETSA